MPRVFIGIEMPQHVPGRHLELLRQARFDIKTSASLALEGEELIAQLEDVDAIVAGGQYFTGEALDRLPSLRVIARAGVGYDRVDVPAASRRGVVLTITPTANHEAVAEHAMAFILDQAKGISRQDRSVRQGAWCQVLPTFPVRERTLGLVGLGRIGKSVARRAKAFRMNLLAFEAHPDREFLSEHGIELVSLEQLLRRSDFVSLHVPMSADTRELINEKTLSLMKPGSYLINTSRGGLIEEKALLRALQSGHLAGAGLDVFATEPIPTDHPFLKLENVVLTAHHAGSDAQSAEDMAAGAAQSIVDLHQGAWPAAAVVNSELRSGWSW